MVLLYLNIYQNVAVVGHSRVRFLMEKIIVHWFNDHTKFEQNVMKSYWSTMMLNMYPINDDGQSI